MPNLPYHRRLTHRELLLAHHLLRQRDPDCSHGVHALSLTRQPTQLRLLKEGDWAGILATEIGLLALQTVLEKGNNDDWFAAPFIQRLGILAFVSLTLFARIELTAGKPLIRLRLLKGCHFGFGSVHILPAHLAQAPGYNAEHIGNVLAWTGLPQLLHKRSAQRTG